MIVTVNGTRTDVASDTTVADVVRSLVDIDAGGIAVAVNDTVIPKRVWASHRLASGDVVEVIRAVQGG